MRRVPPLGIHDGETLPEFPGLDELTSARVLGRLLYAVADASFEPSSRTLETSENTELLDTQVNRPLLSGSSPAWSSSAKRDSPPPHRGGPLPTQARTSCSLR